MVSEKAKTYLKRTYGDNYFGWDISDTQLRVILEEGPLSYNDLDEKCTALENTIRAIESMLERMNDAR